MARPQEINYDIPLIIEKLNAKKSRSEIAKELGHKKCNLCTHLRKLEREGKIHYVGYVETINHHRILI